MVINSAIINKTNLFNLFLESINLCINKSYCNRVRDR